MNKLVAAVLLSVVGCVSCQKAGLAVADSEAGRQAAAKRYMDVVPVQDLVDGMLEEMSKVVPEAKRADFSALVREFVQLDKLKAQTTDLIVKHFTVAEINAMAEFYGSPMGKSILKKTRAYSADIARIMQEDLQSNLPSLMQKMRERGIAP